MNSRSPATGRSLDEGIRHALASKLSSRDTDKVALAGTDRARLPGETLSDALRWGASVGVTRLGDVTRLDTIGIPTYQAVRPNSKTLTVSQGKGVTEELAKISALMESIELWHAEQDLLTTFSSTIRELRPTLTYDPYRDLPILTGSFLHEALPVEWVMAMRLADGGQVPVPYRLVMCDSTAPERWRPRVFMESSNGLASGNTFVEATLHGLYEVIERDALTRASVKDAGGRPFDLREIGSKAVDGLLDTFAAADVLVDARWLASPTGLPCVMVRIVSADYPRVAGGSGCHLRMDVAAIRALTEAAQSRATMIAGARDDLSQGLYGVVHHMDAPPKEAARDRGRLPAEVLGSTSHGSLFADLCDVASRCMTAYSGSPLVVELTRPDVGVPVVRVIVPGCLLGEDLL